MSYHEELVTKLSHNTPNNTCCRLAFLSAVVKIDGSIHLKASNTSLELKISNIALARHVKQEFKSLFGLSATISILKNKLKNLTQSRLLIDDAKSLKTALKKLGIMENNHLNFGLPKNLIKRSCCRSLFLRGAFLAGGYLNLAETVYLEIASQNEHLIKEVSKMLIIKNHLKNRVRKKDNYFSFYIKEREQIASFLKIIKAPKATLDFENASIVNILKNRANRLANAETANKNKVIKNAFRQIKEIYTIENTIGLKNITPKLQEICKVRLENPEASLTKLGSLLDPPLAKSAVNHRLRRIRQIADKVSKE